MIMTVVAFSDPTDVVVVVIVVTLVDTVVVVCGRNSVPTSSVVTSMRVGLSCRNADSTSTSVLTDFVATVVVAAEIVVVVVRTSYGDVTKSEINTRFDLIILASTMVPADVLRQ